MFAGAQSLRAGALACVLVVCLGASGCSISVPSIKDMPPRPVHSKLGAPILAQDGVLTVAIDEDDAPHAFKDDQGVVRGYAADVSRAIAERLGLKVSFVQSTDPSAVGGSTGADIFMGATAKDAGDSIKVLGDYLQTAPALFATASAVHEDMSVQDLAGARIGVQGSSVSEDMLRACGVSAEHKSFNNVNDCLKALDNGEIDYAVCGSDTGAYVARAYPNIVFAGTMDAAEDYGVAVRATNGELSEAVQGALDDISADGTLDTIYACWFGKVPMGIADAMLTGAITSDDLARMEDAASREDALGTQGNGETAPAAPKDPTVAPNNLLPNGELRPGATVQASSDEGAEASL